MYKFLEICTICSFTITINTTKQNKQMKTWRLHYKLFIQIDYPYVIIWHIHFVHVLQNFSVQKYKTVFIVISDCPCTHGRPTCTYQIVGIAYKVFIVSQLINFGKEATTTKVGFWSMIPIPFSLHASLNPVK